MFTARMVWHHITGDRVGIYLLVGYVGWIAYMSGQHVLTPMFMGFGLGGGLARVVMMKTDPVTRSVLAAMFTLLLALTVYAFISAG